MLFGSYPNGSPRDPEVYGLAVVGLLGKYPSDVIMRVCNPLSGIPTKCSFLPTIADLSAALELEMKPYRDQQRELRNLAQLPAPSSISEEERARVSKRFAELSSSLAASTDPKLGFKKRRTA